MESNGYILTAETIVLLLVSTLAFQYFTPRINHIPGPFLAKFTNLWRLINVWKGRADVTQLRLHKKYGPAVRLGPNMISLDDPTLIPIVYSSKDKWIKSDLYTGE